MCLLKNSLLISILIFLMVIFQGCWYGDPACYSSVYILNNSNKTLEFYFDSSSIISSDSIFKKYSKPIYPFSNKELCSWWKKIFGELGIIDEHLFLFDKAVVDSVPWDTIKVHNMYLKRIDFTRATLDSLHWTLTYP